MFPAILSFRPQACRFRALSAGRVRLATVQRTDGGGGGEKKECVDAALPKPAAWPRPPLHLPLTSLLPRPPSHPRPRHSVVSLPPPIFTTPLRLDILHLCVQHHLDSLRQGSANTRTRAEVHGSGRKLRPQKGTGMARLGDKGSPVLRGGGVAHGPKPRSFATSLPGKVRALGMRVALAEKLREGGLGVVRSLEWGGGKTGELRRRVGVLGWRRVLLVTGREEVPEKLARCARNLREVRCMVAREVGVYELLRWQTVVMDVEAVDYFEKKYAAEGEMVLQAVEKEPATGSVEVQAS